MIFPRRHIKIPAKLVSQMSRAFVELGEGEGAEGDRVYMVGVALDALYWEHTRHPQLAWNTRRHRFVVLVKRLSYPIFHPRARLYQRRVVKEAQALTAGHRAEREANQFNGLFPIGEAPVFVPEREERNA